MQASDIHDMFEGIDDETLDLICRKPRTQLLTAINGVNTSIAKAGLTKADLTPMPCNIMHAFRLTPVGKVRVVLLGQDPYIKFGQAMGLSFSVPRGFRPPPSLRAIYTAAGVISESGDLTHWAEQGVLLLNSALTTVLGRSNAHASEWAPYTDTIISALGALERPIVFILLGVEAQKKAALIGPNHHILEWGHPSPMNAVNKRPGPLNFKHCTVFRRTNELLTPPIRWDPNPQQAQFTSGGTIWLFTDGAATANGRAGCQAAWGCYIVNGADTRVVGGLVPQTAIEGKKYEASNNRGELLALYEALKLLPTLAADGQRVRIISDSAYAVNSATKWIVAWLADADKAKGKLNLDLIQPMYQLFVEQERRLNLEVLILHETCGLKSHSPEPADRETYAWFCWNGNARADEACTSYLKK